MAINFKVKNTFLEIERSTENTVQRSSSVPFFFKPGDFCCGEDKSIRSEDSTRGSDELCDSDSQGIPDYCDTDEESDFVCRVAGTSRPALLQAATVEQPKVTLSLADMAMADEPSDASNANKVTLSLCDMVSEQEKIRTKLRSKAKTFQSVRAPPTEVATLIKGAVEVLSSDSDIAEVQVHDGGMGGTTMIVGKSSKANPDARMIFALVKDALLRSAEASENTYIMGYGAQPFNNLDSLSFSANVACPPVAHHDTTCWDTYENGFCPRCATCRWNHPSDTDKMRVIVMIQKAA